MGFQADAQNPASGQFINSQELLGWRLTSKALDRVLQFQRVSFSYSHLPPYSDWDNFRNEAKRYWESYRSATGVEGVTRIAVRVINKIPVPKAIVNLEEYLTVYPLIPQTLPSTANALFVQLQLPMQYIYSDARAIINVSSGHASEDDPHLVLDIDLFVERIVSSGEEMWETLEKFGLEKDVIFEACITDKVREAIR